MGQTAKARWSGIPDVRTSAVLVARCVALSCAAVIEPANLALFFAATLVLAITPVRQGAAARPDLIRRGHEASGGAMIVLGVGPALTRRAAV